MKVAFLGVGRMGSALIEGAIQAKFLKGSDIVAFDVDAQKSRQLARRLKIKAANSLGEVSAADYLFVCVKPQQVAALLSEIGNQVTPRQCVVSIAAGVPIKVFESRLAGKMPVIRVMPNTPALVHCGMSALAAGQYAKPAQMKFVKSLLSSVGKAVVLPEKHLDAVTAVSGSGPAYLFLLAEAFVDAAQTTGLDANLARLLVNQTLLGAAKMLEGNATPTQLREQVTSPGGTTEAALKILESQKWSRHFVQAVQAARDRSRALSVGWK